MDRGYQVVLIGFKGGALGLQLFSGITLHRVPVPIDRVQRARLLHTPRIDD